jgi:solute carrier family 24 (sodium/potassium/calcium exchanger), member 6
MNLSTGEGYHVNISPTLLVSTISLFITLTSMLIVVPLSKWRMTRLFGICLVVFFTLSTATSVLVEVLL